MGWERRRRGGAYYTRSRKVGGRVVREYLGSGPRAEPAARADEQEREMREAEAARWKAERARFEAAAAQTHAAGEGAELLMRVLLRLGGYHQHHRGEWRRSRERAA